MTPVLLVCAALSVIDGDSVRCINGDVSVNMRLLGDGEPNVAGVDAPEIGHRADCPREAELAERAKRRLSQLVLQPGIQIHDSGERDRYDRPLVKIVLPNERTAGQTLIDEGLAGEWRPGRHIDWCAPQ